MPPWRCALVLISAAFLPLRLLRGPHKGLLAFRVQLADALRYTDGKFGEAEVLYGEAVAVRRRTLGVSHPRTLHAITQLADVYKIKGDYSSAAPLMHEALEATGAGSGAGVAAANAAIPGTK